MRFGFLVLFSLAVGAALAAEPPVPGGTDLLPEELLSRATLGKAASEEGTLADVPGDRADLGKIWRITVPRKAKSPWNVQFKVPIRGTIRQGDVLFVEFWARRISSEDESGEARGTLVMEIDRPPYDKTIVGFPWSAGGEWRRVTYPTKAAIPIADGEGTLNLELGDAAQVVEIGGLAVRNYGPGFDIRKLPPAPAITYAGREPDAAWRQAAAARIEKFRKAGLSIHIIDASGKPVPDAEVRVEETKSAFRFGTAVNAGPLFAPEAQFPGTDRYREMIPQLFNMITMEGELKWPSWEKDPARALRIVDWARERGLDVRGHNIVWPSWRFSPGDLPALAHDPAALRKRVLDHARDILSATGGKVDDWDVVNEPELNHDLMDACGDGIVVDLYKLAKELHPNGKLFLNESVTFSRLDKIQRTVDRAVDWRKRGAPIDGLGLQCHYAWTLTPPEQVVAELDKLAPLGFALQVTEFDLDLTDEALQADYLRDFLTALFSHPAVGAFQMWGFWEGRHWRPNAALWRKDWSIKPAGQAYLDLLKEWSTHEKLATGADGQAATRAFLGDYRISAAKGKAAAESAFTLGAEGGTVTLTLGADER